MIIVKLGLTKRCTKPSKKQTLFSYTR